MSGVLRTLYNHVNDKLGLSKLATAAAVAVPFATAAAPAQSAEYDLCIGFVVDASMSTQDYGFRGQMDGIADGLTHPDVLQKIREMHTGMRAFLVVFSNTAGPYSEIYRINNEAGAHAFADHLRQLPKPLNGNNNLMAGLRVAEAQFDQIAAEGDRCMRSVIDFSGDGEDVQSISGVTTDQLHGQVIHLAQNRGITINTLSFNDVHFNKYPNIHGYYREILTTPPRMGVMPGMHVPVPNTGKDDTAGLLRTNIAEWMRRKVVFEIAGIRAPDMPQLPGDDSPSRNAPTQYAALAPSRLEQQ